MQDGEENLSFPLVLDFGREPEQGCLAPSVKVWCWVRSRILSETLSFFPGLNYPPKSQASNKLVHQFSKFLQPTKDQDFVHHTRHSQEEFLVPAPNPGHLTSHPSGLPDAQFVWTPAMTVEVYHSTCAPFWRLVIDITSIYYY